MATYPLTEDASFVRLAEKLARPIRSSKSQSSRLLHEGSFRQLISLEKSRSKRSGKPRMLMLFNVSKASQEVAKGEPLAKIASAISASTRETDILGWYESGSTLGLMFTEIGSSVNSSLIADKVTQALRESLTDAQFAGVLSEVHLIERHLVQAVRRTPSASAVPQPRSHLRSTWARSVNFEPIMQASAAASCRK
jgi:hypothetical protein